MPKHEALIRTNVVLHRDQLERLRQLATTDDRSVSWLLRQIVTEFLKDPRVPWTPMDTKALAALISDPDRDTWAEEEAHYRRPE